MLPSLSVCMTARNESAHLPRQLAALARNLGPDDEFIAADDGSTDNTLDLLQAFQFPRKTIYRRGESIGVCAGYNDVAGRATRPYLHLVSGNDEVQDGAYDLFRRAAKRWPEAQVFFGDVAGWRKLGWSSGMAFLTLSEIRSVWNVLRAWDTHGASVLLARTSFGQGYPLGLRWMADWFQALVIALRHGCVHLGGPISKVHQYEGQFSFLHSDNDAYNAVIRELWRIAETPEYADVARDLVLYKALSGWLEERCLVKTAPAYLSRQLSTRSTQPTRTH